MRDRCVNRDDGVVLVTGGAGFIGSNLCNRLVNSGEQVLCIDNLVSGFKSNNAQITNAPNFTFVEADVTDTATFLGLDDVRYIYNLAGRP